MPICYNVINNQNYLNHQSIDYKIILKPLGRSFKMSEPARILTIMFVFKVFWTFLELHWTDGADKLPYRNERKRLLTTLLNSDIGQEFNSFAKDLMECVMLSDDV